MKEKRLKQELHSRKSNEGLKTEQLCGTQPISQILFKFYWLIYVCFFFLSFSFVAVNLLALLLFIVKYYLCRSTTLCL